ncbi:MAG: response regulator transcription factor [candidate division Zixibacteria bacterium]|nr:response regulator transcription factor [candidate division Zixibacteria bacterium]
MSGEKILVVEDEAAIRELIAYNLKREGYVVDTADSGEDGLRMAFTSSPALILLDLMLPGMDGLAICRALRADKRTSSIPIIMLTARSEETDVVTGLGVGADDYVTKPFSPRVLVARVRAFLRRATVGDADPTTVLIAGQLSIDPGRHDVRVDGTRVELTPTEFQILLTLVRRPGWVFSRYQIVNAVRGSDAIITDRAVDVQIVGLRKKLGDCGHYIETVRGVGYRFKELE